MNCDPLAFTGPDNNLALLLLLGIAVLVAGAALLLAVHKRRGATPATMLTILLVAAAFAMLPPTPALAAGSDCTSADNSLTVTQTSVMDNLAPEAAPVPITGRVLNNGPDDTTITAVMVEITSVTLRPGAPAGACDASDYVVLNPLMPVGVHLDPAASTPFAGASIGFNNKNTNQDACQNATVHLLYTANPR